MKRLQVLAMKGLIDLRDFFRMVLAMVRYKNETPITAEEIQAQADSLARIAQRYRECAELLAARQIDKAMTTHWASAKHGMEAITRHSSELLFGVETRLRRIAADDAVESEQSDKKPTKKRSGNVSKAAAKAEKAAKESREGKTKTQ